jgi:hypothetical protein
MAQLQMATAGRFGILKQTAFETIQSNDSNFHYFSFTQCNYGPQQGDATLPLEAGSTYPFPAGTYKTGLFFAGNVAMIPRLENRFGYILEGVCGDVSTWSDVTIDQHIAAVGANVGVYAHQFLGLLDATGTGTNFTLPYYTTHRLMPNTVTASEVGEISQDMCFSALQMNVGAAGIVTANVGMVGRGFSGTIWDLNPGWTSPTLDDIDTFMVTSCTGFVKISISGGTPATVTTQDVTGAQFTFINQILPPNQARIVGSPYHVDHPNLARFITVDIPTLVTDYDVYMQAFGGPANPVVDTGWSCTPLDGDIDIELQSPSEISGAATTAYHTWRFRTTQANAKFTVQPLVLVPGQPVVFAMRCQIARPSSGIAYEMYLQNGQASY